MVRLIASDIDGTLLHGSQTQIDPAVFREIRRLRERGILFCPASGRQYGSLRWLFAPVAEELFYLCENGAVVYGPGSPGPVLGKTAMDRELALKLCGEIAGMPECEVLISGANTSYLCPKHPDIISHIRYFVGNHTDVVPSPSAVPEDILKVSAYCRQGAQRARSQLAPRWEGCFNTAIAGEKWLDFTLADKGTGLRQLCAVLGVSLDEAAAFGDNYNDLPMLEAVGRPYIMASAARELKERFPNQCSRVADVLKTIG